MTLATTQVHAFQTEGFISAIPVMEPEDARELNRRVKEFTERRPDDAQWAFDIKCNLLFDWVYAVCASPRMVAAVTPLLGPDIFATNAVFRNKHPGTVEQYGWHQDDARVQVDPGFLIVFIALSPQTEENGCLQVVPGSHGVVREFEVVSNPSGQARRQVARVKDVDAGAAVPILLAPGEAVIFSGSLIHGSGPNRSTTQRGALLIDYTAARARQSIGQGSGQLVAGRDSHGNCANEPVPRGDCEKHDIINRRTMLQRYPVNPLMGPLPESGKPDFPDAPIQET